VPVGSMFKTLAQVEVNDRLVLPPFVPEVESHSSRRRDSRRVLAITQEGESVTVVLDGHEARTLPASLKVLVL